MLMFQAVGTLQLTYFSTNICFAIVESITRADSCR